MIRLTTLTRVPMNRLAQIEVPGKGNCVPTFLIYTFKEPALLARTITALSPHDVIVHVDAKIDQQPFIAALKFADRPRVRFLEHRFKVNWAGYSQVEAIRALVQQGIAQSDSGDYLILLSGQDYPIKPMNELVEFLRRGRGRQYLRYFEIENSNRHYRAQISHRHHRDLRFASSLTTKPTIKKLRNGVIRALDALERPKRIAPPTSLRVAFGPTHFAMTASFAAELESLVTRDIESYFRLVFCPEEKFYQSLAALSRRAGEIEAPLPGGFEPFVGSGNHLYANLHHIDQDIIKVFTEHDWEEVKQSDKFFLRKLEARRSGALLNMIDEQLLGKVSPSDHPLLKE